MELIVLLNRLFWFIREMLTTEIEIAAQLQMRQFQ